MTKRRFCFTFFLLICFSLPLTATAQTVNIPDLNLHNAIWHDLGYLPDGSIPAALMATLTELDAPNANITNLTGLEAATNLTQLNLDNNSISDISAIANLTNLTSLSLSGNSISDISPLVANTGLGNGDLVDVTDNPLNDASINTHILALQSRGVTVEFSVNIPDSNLHNAIWHDLGYLPDGSIPAALMATLTELDAPNANITNLTGLEAATNLTELYLGNNSISDISAIANLTDLRILDLSNNSITDLSPLVEHTGLGNGGTVDVTENPLNHTSITSHIPALLSRGVTVKFDEPVDIPDPNLRAAIENALRRLPDPNEPIFPSDMAGLTRLEARNANISDLTGLQTATNLTWLGLGPEQVQQGVWRNSNSITDISALQGLTKLEVLDLEDNSISNISALERLTNLAVLNLGGNSISDISPLTELTNLTELYLWDNSISDMLPVAGLTNLTGLSLGFNTISDISAVAGLTNLTFLSLRHNSISDISPVVGLANLTRLALDINSISDMSPVAGLTNLTGLFLQDNSISDISAVAGLTNLTELALQDNSISDLSPLVANTGLGSGDLVDVSENPLNFAPINTHILALQSRGVEVFSFNLKPTMSEFTLSIPAGISLIHVPLRVAEVDGKEQTIESISDLYDALGGASTVNFLITYDSISQEWYSYFVPSDKGGTADSGLGDDTGIIVGLRMPASVHLRGTALGTNGNSTINLGQGLNVVGLPLNDSRIERVSDLFTLDGIGDNVPVIILTDSGEFKAVGRADDPGDIAITGGQAFIMNAPRAAIVDISGDAWANDSGAAAAPPVTLKGIEVRDTTPVLGLRGSIVDERTGLKAEGFRLTVKNLLTGRAVATVTRPDEAGYRSTVVDIETGRAATVGDVLEISAQSPNPFIGVDPVRYTVTAEDVKQSLIQLPELVAYEIPAETQLLSNYPNPFNPETWIPYRLAENAFVTLAIYDLNGQIVRTIDVGHQVAAVYENRSKAVYWDGRNGLGEQVASGVYFYHLSAGRSGLSVPHRSDYSATRKMVILK